jgi:hypothetical protein
MIGVGLVAVGSGTSMMAVASEQAASFRGYTTGKKLGEERRATEKSVAFPNAWYGRGRGARLTPASASVFLCVLAWEVEMCLRRSSCREYAGGFR